MRRAGWAALLTPPAVAVTVTVLVATDESQSVSNAFGLLEMMTPLVAGVGAASLVGRDRAAELQLTLPTPYRATLLRRLAVALGWTVLVAVLVAATLVLGGWWTRWPHNHGPLVGQLIWLAPMLCLGGLGFLAAAVCRGPAAASGVVAICWLGQQLFADAIQVRWWGRLVYLFATTRGTERSDWAANRSTLLAAALVLAAAAWLVLGRTERLVHEEGE
ncbi:hypothetical protein WEI85_11625 [Actinomycetes bacterium KLBMP 9797]